MGVNSELREDESLDVGLRDGTVDVRQHEPGRLIEKKNGERDLDVDRVHHERPLVVAGLK